MSDSDPTFPQAKSAPKTVLIDADILVYLAGFASQKTIYTHTPSGEWFEGKKAANEWLGALLGCAPVGEKGKKLKKEDWHDADWEDEIVQEPWANCQFILEGKIVECMRAVNADRCKLFFTPKVTFRHELATTKEYKGNRVSNRPLYATKIKEWLHENYECEIGDNLEADDLLGLQQTTDTAIATNDKDLLMIPGEHYNWGGEGTHFWQDALGADNRFFVQLLAGDSTDNIQGIPGVGEKGAEKIVASWEGNHFGLVEDINEMYCQHYGAAWQATRDEHAALVWILRSGETPETAGWRGLLHDSTS
jgi:hypothetical protein